MGQKFFCYLTLPGKTSEVIEPIDGVRIRKENEKLYKLLNGIFIGSNPTKEIPIAFLPDANGSQKNVMRDMILNHLDKWDLESGRPIAEKMQLCTTKVSGMGLLFLLSGKNDSGMKIVISRFPADTGIMAERDEGGLKVELIEKVFMKDAFSYKSVAYEGKDLTSAWWDGRAIDKQLSHGVKEVSDYWIRSFLDSDFLATSRAGTRRLALAIREALRSEKSASVQSELISAATLLVNQDGKNFSLEKFFKSYSLSEQVCNLIRENYPNTATQREHFVFSVAEYSAHAAIRHVGLDNGATISAPVHDFSKIVIIKEDGKTGETQFTTKGKVKKQRISGGE